MLTGLDNNPIIVVTKDEICHAYLQYLIEQDHSYFDTAPTANKGDAALSIVEIDSRFEAEHVNGILRYLVGARAHLSNSVGIFPVFNQDAFDRVAQDLVVNKILNNPNFNYLVKDKTPLIELSVCQDFPEILEKRNAEEQKRCEQDREANDIALMIIEENGINQDIMLLWYLQAIATSNHAYLGNRDKPNLSFKNCDQLIIPFRKDENHYTVAVVDCYLDDEDKKIVEIKYYDSLGNDLDESYKQQLIAFFMESGFDQVKHLCVSKPDQKDGYNCAIFASFKAIDLANENEGNQERLLQDLGLDYHALFNYFRNRVTEMLRESGCNISLSPEMVDQLKIEQEERERPKAQGIISWMYEGFKNATSTLFENSKKRKADVLTNENIVIDPFQIPDNNEVLLPIRKTVIAKRSFPVPSALYVENEKSIEQTITIESDSDDDSEFHFTKKSR